MKKSSKDRYLSGISEDLQDTKEFKKARKVMGDDLIKDFFKKDENSLKEVIAVNSVEVQNLSEKAMANPKWVEFAAALKLLKSALRETVEPSVVAINLATVILSERKG